MVTFTVIALLLILIIVLTYRNSSFYVKTYNKITEALLSLDNNMATAFVFKLMRRRRRRSRRPIGAVF